MRRRLEYLKHLRSASTEDAIFALREFSLVSNKYDFRNLATDLWYLRTRDTRRRCDYIIDPHEPLKGLWFGCVVMAISDVKERRPCDLHAWRYDSPPMGIDTCSEEVHICAPAALGFLLSLTDEQELYCGLTPGTIRDIVGSKNSCP